MKPRHRKLAFIAAAVIGLSAATLLVLNAFRSNLVFFHTPSEVIAGKVPTNTTVRIGGLVENGSVQRSADSLQVSFAVTDLSNSVRVSYQGILPDLFREGQGVVVQGRMQSGRGFVADQVLAKHDEKYMPPEAAAALDQAARTLQQP
jgi:cytochrome c-type biogenesis protein CcmE